VPKALKCAEISRYPIYPADGQPLNGDVASVISSNIKTTGIAFARFIFAETTACHEFFVVVPL
jgi:hypothetical protein